MLEGLVAVVLVAAVVAIGITFHIQQKEQAKQEALAHALARIAGGEYLNWSKAKRFFASRDNPYSMDGGDGGEHKEYRVEEDAGIYEAGISVSDRDSINTLNQQFVARRLLESSDLFEKLELTDAQRLAVVRDEDANLINAGAGAGKTRTILSKVEYIIAHGLAGPAEILIAVYNKRTEQEISKKIEKIHADITVSTFHSLGLKIIKQVESERVNISKLATDDKSLGHFLSDMVRRLLKKRATIDFFVEFFSTHYVEGDPKEGIKTQEEYLLKISYVEMRSLNGEQLKSHEEVQIANWLILNGINWEYERDYPHNKSKKQHKPDFYLPDYDLWIEHFGIDENGNTAPGVDKEKYNETMKWKRSVHAENETKLVETYSHEAKSPGGLPAALDKKLTEYGVKKGPVTDKGIDKLVETSFKPESNFVKMVKQFLAIAKENKLSEQILGKRATSARDWAFLALFGLFRNHYEKTLAENAEIDFTDMIVRGAKYVENGQYQSGYKYILVDEYQDITKVRLEFLRAMQRQVTDCRIFCVGDDWQSIYQFQGANVELITHFENYVSAMQRTDLDQTFRYSQKISDFSSIFVTQNPAQLKKQIHSQIASAEEERPIKIIYHDEKNQREKLTKIIDVIADQARDGRQKCFVLGRYNHNKPDAWQELARYAKLKAIDMEFSTIHKSKGSEADWVIVVENKSALKGHNFPANTQNDPVLKMAQPEMEHFPNAEERRLFYVAITRTKRGVFLLAPSGQASTFIREICPPLNQNLNQKTDAQVIDYSLFVEAEKHAHSTPLFCPECKGQTIRKKFINGDKFFYACAHFPACKGVLPRCANENCDAAIDLTGVQHADTYQCECGHPSRICPRCRAGILLEKASVYGKFWGCSRFPITQCRYQEKIVPQTNASANHTP